MKKLCRQHIPSPQEGQQILLKIMALSPLAPIIEFGTYITYDSSAPTYDPTNPATWTPEIYLGNLELTLLNPTPSHIESLESILFTELGVLHFDEIINLED